MLVSKSNSRYRHNKKGGEYVVLTSNCLFQNPDGEWVPAVSYMSCDPHLRTLFVRTKEDFEKSFTPFVSSKKDFLKSFTPFVKSPDNV